MRTQKRKLKMRRKLNGKGQFFKRENLSLKFVFFYLISYTRSLCFMLIYTITSKKSIITRVFIHDSYCPVNTPCSHIAHCTHPTRNLQVLRCVDSWLLNFKHETSNWTAIITGEYCSILPDRIFKEIIVATSFT